VDIKPFLETPESWMIMTWHYNMIQPL